jgi:hypothetical protein
MPHTSDPELQQLMDAWRAPAGAPAGPPAAICRHVRRRSRLLWASLAAEALVVIAIAPVLFQTAIAGDAFEKVAMASLAAISLGAIGFSWWNWHDAIRASGESTSAFLELSRRRVTKLARAVSAGWVVLGAEVVVFIPWIANRLFGGPEPASLRAQVFSWGLLALMTTLGVAALVALARWAERERASLDALRRELDDDETRR